MVLDLVFFEKKLCSKDLKIPIPGIAYCENLRDLINRDGVGRTTHDPALRATAQSVAHFLVRTFFVI